MPGQEWMAGCQKPKEGMELQAYVNEVQKFILLFLIVVAWHVSFKSFHTYFKEYLRKRNSGCLIHFGSPLLRSIVIICNVFNKGLTDI